MAESNGPWRPPAGYFDAASAEPPPTAVAPAVGTAAEAAWVDPGRRYRAGRRAALLLQSAREALADFLDCPAARLVVVPSAEVAAAAALRGITTAQLRRGAPANVALSAVERSGLLAEAGRLHLDRGVGLTSVPVQSDGSVEADVFLRAAADSAVAVLQAANPEVGTLQPIDVVAAGCAAMGVPLLIDATATAGRIRPPAEYGALWADPRAWGGLPGVGLLALHTTADPVLAPDRFEQGAWPGPVPLPALVAAATAAEVLTADRAAARREDERLRGLVARLRSRFLADIPDCEAPGDSDHRLPHLLSVSFLYVAGEELLDELDRRGFAVASGSACAGDNQEVAPSHVLAAMGALTSGNLRISLPRGVAEVDVERLIAELPPLVAQLRSGLGADRL